MAAKQKRPYEEIVLELEQVLAQLEDGSLPLSDLLTLYERGAALAKEAGARLDAYEARLTALSLPAEEENGI